MGKDKEHIRLQAWNVVTKVIGPVEFEVEVSEEEAEKIKAQMMGSEFYEPSRYGCWAEKGAALLDEKFGPQDQDSVTHLLHWAEGEIDRWGKVPDARG